MYPRKRKEKKTRRDEIDGSVDLRVFELMDPSSVRPSERPSQTQLDEKLKGRKRYIEDLKVGKRDISSELKETER